MPSGTPQLPGLHGRHSRIDHPTPRTGHRPRAGCGVRDVHECCARSGERRGRMWTCTSSSRASVAGPTLACWLHRYGFRVTVVERAPALRKAGGHAVDLFAPALDIVERMGLLDAVQERRDRHGTDRRAARGRAPVRDDRRRAADGRRLPPPRRDHARRPGRDPATTPPATTSSTSSATPSTAIADDGEVALRARRAAPVRPGRRGRRAALHGARGSCSGRSRGSPGGWAPTSRSRRCRTSATCATAWTASSGSTGWPACTARGTCRTRGRCSSSGTPAPAALRSPRRRRAASALLRGRSPTWTATSPGCSTRPTAPTRSTSTRSPSCAWTRGHAGG